MSLYTVYQCSICRRTKDVAVDNLRAAPNYCNITKGCAGRLFKIGETTSPTMTPSESGLIDWYPRNQQISATPVEASEQFVSLSSSSIGGIAIGIFESFTWMTQQPIVKMKLSQRRLDDVNYQQFVFRTSSVTTVLTGRDSTGKNMRFDQSAIDEGRVFIRVNGVARFQGFGADEVQLTPNTVTFNTSISAASTVEVLVFTEKTTITRFIEFRANHSLPSTAETGAWGNIRWTQNGTDDVHDATTSSQSKWWVYTCSDIAEITSASRLKIEGIYMSDETTQLIPDTQLSTVRFLLASSPYENPDRYLNFYVDAQELHGGYHLLSSYSTYTELLADQVALKELYPPMRLIKQLTLPPSSFISEDTYSTSSAIQTDTTNARISGKKIIGPI